MSHLAPFVDYFSPCPYVSLISECPHRDCLHLSLINIPSLCIQSACFPYFVPVRLSSLYQASQHFQRDICLPVYRPTTPRFSPCQIVCLDHYLISHVPTYLLLKTVLSTQTFASRAVQLSPISPVADPAITYITFYVGYTGSTMRVTGGH